MQRKRWLGGLMLMFGLLLAPSAAHAGGWAVITLVDLPETVPVGEPVILEFVVRQHGHPEGLLPGLTPTITAMYNGRVVKVDAQAGDSPGHYVASLVLPAAGVWNWKVQAFSMDVAMPSLIAQTTANEPESPVRELLVERFFLWLGRDLPTEVPIQPQAPVVRGRDLFIAKGCATCHLHASVQPAIVTQLGPDLSDYETNPDFVRVWLRNAATFTSDSQWPMPTLELSDDEIDALIAFLDAGGNQAIQAQDTQ